MAEEWREMEGHPKFLVSSCGRVANTSGKVYSQWVTRRGYAQINVCENGKTFTFKVHREVAKAFLPAERGKTQINHKDGNKLNNSIENLEWCTAKENMRHAFDVLGRTNKPIGEKAVICEETRTQYSSINDASRKTGFARQNISRCCHNPEARCHGFHWKFIEREDAEDAQS